MKNLGSFIFATALTACTGNTMPKAAQPLIRKEGSLEKETESIPAPKNQELLDAIKDASSRRRAKARTQQEKILRVEKDSNGNVTSLIPGGA